MLCNSKLRSASICSSINGPRHSSRVTRPIIDLTKSRQNPGLQNNVVFCNKSSAMFFPSQIIKIWLRRSTFSQRFRANRLVSWPAVLKLPFFHYPYLSISPSLLPPQHTHALYCQRDLQQLLECVCAHSGELPITAVIKTQHCEKVRTAGMEKRETEKEKEYRQSYNEQQACSWVCCFPPQMLRITVLS